MGNKYSSLYFVFLLFLFCIFNLYGSNVYAQFRFPFTKKLSVEILDSELNPKDTSIIITYNLNGPGRRFYNTYLYYSNNRGNSFKGPLRALKGDFGDSIQPGKYLEVKWHFRRDNPYFDGKNTMFKIEALEILKNASGGPENALRSLLIPGFGDTKVRNGYNYGWITAATYSCLGTSALFYFISQKRYNDYENRVPNTEADHQKLFNRAKNAQNLSRAFFFAGASIWLGDIVGVFWRGIKNKRRLARELEQKEEEEENALNRLKFSPIYDGQRTELALQWKF